MVESSKKGPGGKYDIRTIIIQPLNCPVKIPNDSPQIATETIPLVCNLEFTIEVLRNTNRGHRTNPSNGSRFVHSN